MKIFKKILFLVMLCCFSFISVSALDVYNIKVILIGEYGHGKTAFANAVIEGIPINQREDRHTIQMIRRNYYMTVAGKQLNLFVNDTSGDDEYRTQVNSYFRDSHFAFICINLSLQNRLSSEDNRDKFIRTWRNKVLDLAPNCEIVIVGTHLDVTSLDNYKNDNYQDNSEFLTRYARDNGIQYIEVNSNDVDGTKAKFEGCFNQQSINRLFSTGRLHLGAQMDSLPTMIEPAKPSGGCC